MEFIFSFIIKYYFIFINIISFFAYGLDKIFAISKKRRIPELTLLNISIFGGAPAGFIAMHLFHHKVKKKKFVVINFLCTVIYCSLIYYFYKYK